MVWVPIRKAGSETKTDKIGGTQGADEAASLRGGYKGGSRSRSMEDKENRGPIAAEEYFLNIWLSNNQ